MVCFQRPNKNQPWNRNLQELQSIEALEVVEAFLKYNSVARMFPPGKGSWVVLTFFCPKNPGGEIKKKWFCGLVFKWGVGNEDVYINVDCRCINICICIYIDICIYFLLKIQDGEF